MFDAGRLEVKDPPPGTAAATAAAVQQLQPQYLKVNRLLVFVQYPVTWIPLLTIQCTLCISFINVTRTQIMNNNDDSNSNTILNYDELITKLAVKCDGFSGASIAGVARAAASRGKCFLRFHYLFFRPFVMS